MTNILLLGASGSLGKAVIPALLDLPDTHLTLYVRNPHAVKQFNDPPIRVIQGDVLDLASLSHAMQGQDIVYAGLSGELPAMAKTIVQAIRQSAVQPFLQHLIFISSMGIYGETGENHGAILDPYRQSAKIIEDSSVSYTLIRPAWFTDGAEIDYQTTQKGQPFVGSRVSRCSIADLVAKIVQNPTAYQQQSIGIAKV